MAATDEGATNARERRRWNDAYWSTVWPRREQLTRAATGRLLDHARLRPGSRVLDVGSGAGIAAIEAARLVGPSGLVLGADISAPLVEFATRRARSDGLTNVRFVAADVQHDPLEGTVFDVIISQFGVMFFDEPGVAFANLRAHAAREGRLAFVCWQPLARNRWHLNHALGGFLPPPPPPRPGTSPTGPFSLADPGHTTDLLAEAGWHEVEHVAVELSVVVDRDAIFDEGQLRLLGIPEEYLDPARAAVEAHLAGLATDEGRYAVELAVQIFSATA